MQTSSFIEQAKKVHANSPYSYGPTEYKNVRTKVTIHCDKHNIDFSVLPGLFLSNKTRCPLCSKENRKLKATEQAKREGKVHDTNSFIKKCKELFGDKYTYEKSVYVNSLTPVTATCRIHGDFSRVASDFTRGLGCQKCGYESASQKNKLSIDEVAKKLKEIWGDKITLHPDAVYLGRDEPIRVVCKVHGEFTTNTHRLFAGVGCKKCSDADKVLPQEDVIQRFINKHGDKYDYSEVVYKGNFEKVKIFCKSCGKYFYQTPNNHYVYGCLNCAHIVSSQERDIADFIRGLGFNVIQSDRTILAPKELDIYVPDKNLAIEFTGLRWHSYSFCKDRYDSYNDFIHHLHRKQVGCESLGIKLLTIYEDEWLSKPDIVMSRIKSSLGVCSRRLYARKLSVSFLDKKIARTFLDKNHIQGCSNSFDDAVGLYDGDELVSVMTFGALPSFRKIKGYEGAIELNRLSCLSDCTVVGGASKMFKFYLRNRNARFILSYADWRWSYRLNNVYSSLGFKLVRDSEPRQFYVKTSNPRKRHYWYDTGVINIVKGKTRKQCWEDSGYTAIPDCGKGLYVYENKDIK